VTARDADETRCDRFERWLDAGASAGGEAEARSHARECRRCHDAWDAMLALDGLLAESAAPAPPGFTDVVMRRVDASPRVSWAWLPALEDPLPWWVRAVMQPSTVLAAFASALLVWKWSEILGVTRGLAQELARVGASWTGGAPAALVTHILAALGSAFGSVAATWVGRDTASQIGLGLALLPALLWASAQLAGWGERLGTWNREPTVH
jgi:hypothetical protein